MKIPFSLHEALVQFSISFVVDGKRGLSTFNQKKFQFPHDSSCHRRPPHCTECGFESSLRLPDVHLIFSVVHFYTLFHSPSGQKNDLRSSNLCSPSIAPLQQIPIPSTQFLNHASPKHTHETSPRLLSVITTLSFLPSPSSRL